MAPEGVELEADEKQGRVIREEFGTLIGSDFVFSLAVRMRAEDGGVGRAELEFAVREACRGMDVPDEADLNRMERIPGCSQTVPEVLIAMGSSPRVSM